MSYAAATAAYRDNEVLTATPQRLVVIVFEYLAVQLRRASIAIDTKNDELRIESLFNARNAVAELIGGLDHERGGEIARTLGALYLFFMQQLVAAGASHDRRVVDRVAAQAAELHSAFAAIATGQVGNAA